jgi:hypothetical protein
MPNPQNVEEFQAWQARQAEESAKKAALFEQVHRYIPFLWLPLGAKNLAEGCAWPALLGFAGMSAIGALGLFRAYRGTLRFYRGGETNKAAPAKPAVRSSSSGKKLLVERELPAIPEDAAAMALACFRSMSRAPEVKMMLVTNALIFAILGASMILRPMSGMSSVFQSATFQSFVCSGVVAASFMGLAQVMFNHFGFDRSGFRALVMLPTPRRRILLGKNLALLPVALVIFIFYLVLLIVLAHMGVMAVLPMGFEFITAFLGLSTLGNALSILVPYRIAAGSLKPTKVKITTQLVMIFTNLTILPMGFILIFSPALLGMLFDQMNWLPGTAVTLACAFLWAILAGVIYWLTLEPLGILLQRREQKILQVVTQEVE